MNTLKYIILGIVLALMFVQAAYAQAPANFEITQKARNLTKQNFVWADSVQANPGDRIEFQIIVLWRGAQAATDVLVGETLGQGLTYAANLKLDGNAISGNLTAGHLNVGTLGTNQSKTITFEATVNAKETFPAGTSNLINTSTVFNAQGAASGISRVIVARDGTPTDVPTGPVSVWMIGLVLLFAAAFAGGSFLFLRSYIQREVFESPYATRTERKLATLIDRLRKDERK